MLEPCDACKKTASLSYCEFRQTTGVLVGNNMEGFSGRFCRECAQGIYAKAMKHCLLLGWWSLWGPLATLVCISHNIKWKKKVQQGFVSPPPIKPTDQLPWGHLMGIRAKTGVLDTPLNWPIGMGAVAVVVFLITSLIMVVEHLSSPNHPVDPSAAALSIGQIVLGVSALVVFLCVLWHRHVYPSPGGIPDLLSEVFPSQMIYQCHGVQLAGVAFQRGNSVRLILGVQNVCKVPLDFKCALENMGEQYSLLSKLESREVALYNIDRPFKPVATMGRMRLGLQFTVSPKSAPKDRHYPRVALSTRGRQDLLALAMAAGGHASWESTSGPQDGIVPMSNVSDFNLAVYPVAPSSEQLSANLNTWETARLGTTQDLTQVNPAIQKLLQVLVS